MRRVLSHVEEKRVAAACQETEKRRLERIRLQIERRDVPLQMVDWRERQALRPRDRLRRGDADEQRADQSGTGGDSNEVDVVERSVRICERFAHDGCNELEMTA